MILIGGKKVNKFWKEKRPMTMDTDMYLIMRENYIAVNLQFSMK